MHRRAQGQGARRPDHVVRLPQHGDGPPYVLQRTGVLSEEGGSGKPDQVMFEGLAQWSGTSFATPVAVGMVAAHMTARAETAPRAARQQLMDANSELAEVRGATVPALIPATWRPTPVALPSTRT
ncbi:hypothetical protein SHIRM173S_10329 [Streptomyces hirsutus]